MGATLQPLNFIMRCFNISVYLDNWPFHNPIRNFIKKGISSLHLLIHLFALVNVYMYLYMFTCSLLLPPSFSTEYQSPTGTHSIITHSNVHSYSSVHVSLKFIVILIMHQYLRHYMFFFTFKTYNVGIGSHDSQSRHIDI